MHWAVAIDASKEGIKFACNGDIGMGSVTLRSHTNAEKPELNIDIELTEPVSLNFSLKYLVNFSKAAVLSTQVKLCLSNEVPLLVEFNLSGSSYLRFYLAPKVGSTASDTRRRGWSSREYWPRPPFPPPRPPCLCQALPVWTKLTARITDWR